MQAEIHPSYEPIVFRDLASGVSFLTRATITSDKTIEWEDGKTYPVHDVEISSESQRVTVVYARECIFKSMI